MSTLVSITLSKKNYKALLNIDDAFNTFFLNFFVVVLLWRQNKQGAYTKVFSNITIHKFHCVIVFHSFLPKI